MAYIFRVPFLLDLVLNVCFCWANGEGVEKEEVELVSVCVFEISVEHTDEGMEMILILTLGLIFFLHFQTQKRIKKKRKS